MQHAPTCGGVQMFVELQFVPLPRNTPPAAWQAAPVNCWHVVPVGLVRQHAPVGVLVTQMLGIVHEVPFPRKIPPAVTHACCVSCWHVIVPPAAMQHAPVNEFAGHDAEVHWDPSPRHTPFWDAQIVSVTMTQTVPPLGDATQHAPKLVPWA